MLVAARSKMGCKSTLVVLTRESSLRSALLPFQKPVGRFRQPGHGVQVGEMTLSSGPPVL